MIDGGVKSVNVQEAVRRAVVPTDNMARDVNACRIDPVGGVIERGVKTVGVEEAVEFETFRGFFHASPDDLAQSVDAVCECLRHNVGTTPVEEAIIAAAR